MTSPEIPPRSEDRGETITRILRDWQDDPSALDRLIPLVYDEMRKIAHAFMRRERRGHTFQTTDLVHEMFGHLKVLNPKGAPVSRHHLLALAAKIMRRVLIDYSRYHNAEKRKGRKETLDDAVAIEGIDLDLLLALDAALKALKEKEPRWNDVVELRFFGGLTIQETADILGVTNSTVKRDWLFAKNWLRAHI